MVRDSKHAHYFELHGAGGCVLQLRVESDAERGEWLASLCAAGADRGDADAPTASVAASPPPPSTPVTSPSRFSLARTLSRRGGAPVLEDGADSAAGASRRRPPVRARTAWLLTPPAPPVHAAHAAPVASPAVAASPPSPTPAAAAEAEPGDGAVFEGTLQKRRPLKTMARLGLGRWQERYCEVRQGVFLYYTRRGDAQWKGTVHLHTLDHVRVAEDSTGAATSTFELSVGGTLFQFRAKTVEMCRQWVRVLREVRCGAATRCRHARPTCAVVRWHSSLSH